MKYFKSYFLFATSLLIVYVFAWKLQASLLFNSDVSWLLLVAKRLLSGGSYAKDFFEINPPLIFYLYTPVVLLNQLFSFDLFILFRIYFFILISLSLLLCTVLFDSLKENFHYDSDQKRYIKKIIIFTLACLLLLFPLGDFGQREHLLVILTLPYFFLVTVRLQEIRVVSKKLIVLVGLLAGLGFAIKPYFLSGLLLVELYYLWRVRQIKNWVRLEAITIAIVIMFYCAMVLFRHYDYLSILIPIVTQDYYQSVSARTSTVLLSNQAIFCYICFAFYWLRFKKTVYQPLGTVLFLGTLGFYLAYFEQHTVWYYHVFPMLSLGILLMVLSFSSLVTQEKYSKTDYIQIILFSAALFAYVYFHLNYIWIGILYYPYVYFGLFFFIITILLSFNGRSVNAFKIIFSLVAIFTCNYVFYRYLQQTIFVNHVFLITTVMLTLFFFVFSPDKENKIKSKYLTLYFLGALLFAYPFYLFGSTYNALIHYRNLLNPFIVFMHHYSGQTVYFFSDSGEFAFPTVNYTNQNYVSRFGCFTWLPDFKNPEDYQQAYFKNKTTYDFYINDIAEDITAHQPDLIFVDERKKGYIGIIQPDYIKFLSQNNHFKQAWNNYHYLASIDGKPLFRFDIYKRVE